MFRVASSVLVLFLLALPSLSYSKDLTGTFLICQAWKPFFGFAARPQGTEIGVYFFSSENYSEIDVEEDGNVTGIIGDRIPPETAWHRMNYYVVDGSKIYLHLPNSYKGRWKGKHLISIDRKSLSYSGGEMYFGSASGNCEISNLTELKKRRAAYFAAKQAEERKNESEAGYKL